VPLLRLALRKNELRFRLYSWPTLFSSAGRKGGSAFSPFFSCFKWFSVRECSYVFRLEFLVYLLFSTTLHGKTANFFPPFHFALFFSLRARRNRVDVLPLFISQSDHHFVEQDSFFFPSRLEAGPSTENAGQSFFFFSHCREIVTSWDLTGSIPALLRYHVKQLTFLSA